MEIPCNNRGCGKRFLPEANPPDSVDCVHHPGAPFFHDAYKGWSCCNKKCTDFTEFLNVPGCARGPHSNVKPEEPESITGRKDERDLQEQLKDFKGVSKTQSPIAPKLPRPDFKKSPLEKLIPTKAANLQIPDLLPPAKSQSDNEDEVKEGELCKNGGCREKFSLCITNMDCPHHPGVPIFHEGMKFWSCCQRKTSDFQAFLEQAGCTVGKHKWKKDQDESSNIKCRYDWHQTSSHVVVAIYAKNYHPDVSTVEVSPVRLKVALFFPQQSGTFPLDVELAGVIVTQETCASFLGSKIEIKMKKAEPGSWPKLGMVQEVLKPQKAIVEEEEKVKIGVDALELDDIRVS